MVIRAPIRDTAGMVSGLTIDRVRNDVDVLSRAGLDSPTFLNETVSSLQRAVPNCAVCVATLDPATRLLTGTYKFGDLLGKDNRDHEWGLIEYGSVETTTFTELFSSGTPAAGVSLVTGGDVARSPRIGGFMRPHFGYSDEVRVLAQVGAQLWAALCFFRTTADGPFDEDDVAFLSSLSQTLGAGLRTGLLAAVAAAPPAIPGGPAVIIVDRNNMLSQVSVGAHERVAEMVSGSNAGAPTGIISSLVAGARRYAAGEIETLPRCRVRQRTGQWFVLHASPLSGVGGTTGDVVVTIEEARPPEIVPLVVAAFGLTARERDVCQLVLQGVETKEISANLHMSTYTVQDHLKSIFEKADVRSRRELMARVFFDQYVSRIGSDLSPSGWFASA